jgi:hypothetical protein
MPIKKNITCLKNNIKIIPFQKELCQALLEINGSSDFRYYKKIIEHIDHVLLETGIEEKFMQNYIQKCMQRQNIEQESNPIDAHWQIKVQIAAKQALRCTIARKLLKLSLREFTCRLSDSSLLQWFCQIDTIGRVNVPSKSQLHRYEVFVEEDLVREMTHLLLNSVNQNVNSLKLSETIDLSNLYVDLTCIKANIHYPVDWVLLRDATITLMKAVKIIRKHGLKNRMEQPEVFIKEINKLSIKMTHSKYKPGSQKSRKKILRLMKTLLNKIRQHAQKHLEMLENSWKKTDLTEKEKNQIVARMNNVIRQLPAAIKQAHDRIIGERLVANDEKILSLYEHDAHVIVRGKAGARVEFGNSLFIAEQKNGLIMDWILYKEQPPADCKTLIPALERIKKAYKEKIKSGAGDRGLWAKENAEYFEQNEIKNYICPRSVKMLTEKVKNKKFMKAQTRRAQTEARIGIIKNCFIGKTLRSKGFANRELNVAYAILAHNLWVLARMMIANEPDELKEAI